MYKTVALVFLSTGMCRCGTDHTSTTENNNPPANTQEQKSQQKPAQMVVLGDSISAGLGASKKSLSYAALLVQNDDAVYPKTDTWDLTSLFEQTPSVISMATPGATSTDVLNKQLPALATQLGNTPQPHTLVIMTAGGNDAMNGIFNMASLTETVIQNLTQTIAFFNNKQLFPNGATLFISDMYDPTDGENTAPGCFGNLTLPNFAKNVDTWHTRYIALESQSNVRIIPSLEAFRGHGFNYNKSTNPYYDTTDATRWFDNDCIHPNDRGHFELRGLFFHRIAEFYAQ
jgi:lysophospholipase L1-like esterase